MHAIALSLLLLGQGAPAATGEDVVAVVSAPVSEDDPAQQAARSLQELDWQRLQTEPAYATGILDAIDLLRARISNREIVAEIENIRPFALVTAGRGDEALAFVDRTLADRPATAAPYGAAWFAALRLNELDRAVRIVEQASRTLRATEWPELREILEKDSVWSVFRALHAREEPAQRVRMAEALLRVGWPGHQEIGSLDTLRTILVEDRMSRGERSQAAAVANGIGTPEHVLDMILQRNFDDVLAPGEDRLAVLARVMSDYDRISAERLAAAPEDMDRILDRAQFLRGQGREADALALLEPLTRDVPGTVARDDQGMWVVNEAAYALIGLRRGEEAVALTAQLAALPIEGNPSLISPSINHGAVLLRVGRNADALAYTLDLERERASYASDYGKMWIYRTIVCALERLDRHDEVAPWLRRMREKGDANPSALTQAYLCVNDLDAAEALLVRRLQGDEPEIALRAVQIYSVDSSVAPDPTDARFDLLRQRPAVRSAVERIGRILELPLSKIYWGTS